MFHSHSSQRFSRPISRPVPGSACTGCADEQPKHRAKGKVAASDTVLGHSSNPYPRSVKTIYIVHIVVRFIHFLYIIFRFPFEISYIIWSIIAPPSFDYISDIIITTQGICICIYIYTFEMKFQRWEVSRSGFGLILSWAGGDGGLHLRKSLKDSPWMFWNSQVPK